MSASWISAPRRDTLALPDRRRDADFDDLFRAHYDRLVRSLTVAGGDREQAADAVQEAFVKAHVRWRRIGRYDDPIGWVRRVAINQLRDDHRRTGRKRQGTRPAGGPHDDLRASPPSPTSSGRLLARLPRQQRIATALFYVDGMSIAEIATALDLAEGTVKSHLHDARVRLRRGVGRRTRIGSGTMSEFDDRELGDALRRRAGAATDGFGIEAARSAVVARAGAGAPQAGRRRRCRGDGRAGPAAVLVVGPGSDSVVTTPADSRTDGPRRRSTLRRFDRGLRPHPDGPPRIRP